MKEEQERALYDLGMEDFNAQYENLKKFMKPAEA